MFSYRFFPINPKCLSSFFLIEMHLNCPPWLEKILKCTELKWLEMHFNCPPWLEKILKCTGLKWLEMHFNCPPWLETF